MELVQLEGALRGPGQASPWSGSSDRQGLCWWQESFLCEVAAPGMLPRYVVRRSSMTSGTSKAPRNKEYPVPEARCRRTDIVMLTPIRQKSPQAPNLISTTLLDSGSGSRAASTTKTTPLAACHLSTPTKRTSP